MKFIGNQSLLSDFRWGDGALLLLFLACTYYAWQWNHAAEEGRLLVEIRQGDQRSFYPLTKERDLPLKDSADQQVMLVKFRNAKVWVQESNCALQYCVLRGSISSLGQWIACLPNQVFIRIFTVKSQPDATASDPFSLDAEVF